MPTVPELTKSFRDTADLMLTTVRKTVSARKGVVLVFAYATRVALEALSPDEQISMLASVNRVIAGKDFE